MKTNLPRVPPDCVPEKVEPVAPSRTVPQSEPHEPLGGDADCCNGQANRIGTGSASYFTNPFPP